MKTRPNRNPIVRDLIANPKRNAGKHKDKRKTEYEKIPNNVRQLKEK
jgi:hypothetical protein